MGPVGAAGLDLSRPTADLRRYLAGRPSTDIEIHVGGRSRHDMEQAGRLARIPGVRIVEPRRPHIAPLTGTIADCYVLGHSARAQ